MIKRRFVYGTLTYEYELIKQDRKSLSLTVKPDLTLVVKCPNTTGDAHVDQFLKRKWLWLEKKRNYFKKFNRKVYQKEFLTGESYYYLGKQYKLVFEKGTEDIVKLTKGQLIIYSNKPATNNYHNLILVRRWYLKKLNRVFSERFDEMLHKFDFKVAPELRIRPMKKRWGSFITKKYIVLNPRLICTAKTCIDYVITHELCHIKYKNHSKQFYDLLENKYPKWEKVKEQLELYGSLIGDIII